MELYYSPFACSLASHIVCREVGIDVTLHRTDFKTKVIEGGGNLQSVSAMGQVPVLVRDDGRVLSENAAVLTYLGDRAADKNLVPDALCFERYELTRFLSLIGTEIHKKGLALVFDPTSPDAVKDFARGAIGRPLDVLEKHLAEREFLLGRAFTVADAYLFWALTLLPIGGVPLDAYPKLVAYRERIGVRPAVKQALDYEQAARKRALVA
jgi:glutathione S-transferase